MELRIYSQEANQPRPRHRLTRWVEEFERWAAPEVEPEREPGIEQEQERSFLPVAVLLGVALLVQYAQFYHPAVRAYLENRDILYRASWISFTIFKQWGLFVLMLLVFAIKEERLASVGFPRLDARRMTVALGLVGFFLGAALLHRPSYSLAEAGLYWMVPLWTGERVLSVALALTAAVVEETFFRGFAIVWTYRWSGSLPFAVLFPALVFSAGHAYLGWLNILFAFAVTLGFSAIFLWRRDLYWLMVVHFVIDVLDLLA
ncbi:MAG: CPBP family intramembrane metalloprotease [Acidobacteria bacterium]|nr:CPBP family intramembrane metalloprotease [Acidobacteriota bacterium]